MSRDLRVGDRVRVVEEVCYDWRLGQEGDVIEPGDGPGLTENAFVQFADRPTGHGATIDRVELVPPAPEPAVSHGDLNDAEAHRAALLDEAAKRLKANRVDDYDASDLVQVAAFIAGGAR